MKLRTVISWQRLTHGGTQESTARPHHVEPGSDVDVQAFKDWCKVGGDMTALIAAEEPAGVVDEFQVGIHVHVPRCRLQAGSDPEAVFWSLIGTQTCCLDHEAVGLRWGMGQGLRFSLLLPGFDTSLNSCIIAGFRG